ncbi:hypothetical protein EQY69_07370 [Clostridium perfringens]|nr:hypothetical protein [Clostridium perfringens]
MSKKSRIYDFLYANAEKEKEVALKALKIRFSLSLPKAESVYKEWRKECMTKPFKVVQDETLKIYSENLIEKHTKKRRKKHKKGRKKYEKVKKSSTKIQKSNIKVQKTDEKLPDLIKNIEEIGFNETVLKYRVSNPWVLKKIYEKIEG